MKVTISTVLHGLFEMDVEEEEKVSSLKTKIESEKSYPFSLQKLIYNGTILKDTSTLRESKIKEDHYIICLLPMNTKHDKYLTKNDLEEKRNLESKKENEKKNFN